jgi:putative addiction module killer protein
MTTPMENQPREIRYYITDNGISPFAEWFMSLRDRRAQSKIELRLRRMELGNWGDCKALGSGLYELRVDTGPGYRIYFGEVGATVVLLLCGGDKSTQDKDIKKAQLYWSRYESD